MPRCAFWAIRTALACAARTRELGGWKRRIHTSARTWISTYSGDSALNTIDMHNGFLWHLKKLVTRMEGFSNPTTTVYTTSFPNGVSIPTDVKAMIDSAGRRHTRRNIRHRRRARRTDRYNGHRHRVGASSTRRGFIGHRHRRYRHFLSPVKTTWSATSASGFRRMTRRQTTTLRGPGRSTPGTRAASLCRAPEQLSFRTPEYIAPGAIRQLTASVLTDSTASSV